MAAQRVFGIALSYEDLIDHCHLRHDATTAALGRKPREVSADAGFCRESNLQRSPHAASGATWRRAAPPTAAPTRADAAGSSPARGWPRWRPSSG
jgi:hypothetical protein